MGKVQEWLYKETNTAQLEVYEVATNLAEKEQNLSLLTQHLGLIYHFCYLY